MTTSQGRRTLIAMSNLDVHTHPALDSRPALGPSVDVVELGLACCALEAVAARCGHRDALSGPGPRSGPASAQSVSSEPPQTILVIAGTVTNAMAASIRARYDALPGPVAVVAFGACATTGGPYWDSYAVMPGVEALLPVDVVVPGCPPRPDALRAALAELHPGEQT